MISDIVSWIPEIAADTNLTEQDWIPLDDAAQLLSRDLRAAQNTLTPSIRERAVALCEQIDQLVARMPKDPRT
ncbi:MAG: hypothetical protein AAGC97_13665 [Planctomycetota bacterium]